MRKDTPAELKQKIKEIMIILGGIDK